MSSHRRQSQCPHNDVQSLFDHHEPSRHHCSVPRDEPLCRQPATDAGRLPGLSGSGGAQRRGRTRVGDDALGMPPPLRTGGPPVTNIRNTSSPHWHGWLKPANRCLVPFNSFAEYAPEPNPETKKKDVVWFALNDDRPLTAFAGIWTEFKGDRGTKSKPVPGPHLVYGFLTTSPMLWSSRSTRRRCR
jgi:putative SOS response-associated peptidase YedK